jgi:hypothetical protein
MAALLAATMAYDVWRVPVQVYDSLIEILDAQRSPSVSASFRGSLDGAAYLRPARIAQIKAIYDLSGDHLQAGYRGFHVALLLAFFWLFARALRVASGVDAAAAVFALTVVTGLHTFPSFMREAFPINHFLEIAVLGLAALNLAQSRGGWWADLAAALVFVLAALTLESGLLVWVVVAAAWVSGLRGISTRGVLLVTALLAGYFVLRLEVLTASVPSLAERSSGFLFDRLEPDDLQRRFGGAPFVFYAYNVAASLVGVLLSEPRDGVFSAVRSWLDGDVLPRTWIAVLSSALTSALIAWAVWRRLRQGGPLEMADRLTIVAAAVIPANAVLAFAYTKDEIMAFAGVFYALAAYAAARAAIARVSTLRRPGTAVVASAVLLAMASLWAVRSVAVHHVMSRQAFRVRNDWVGAPAFLRSEKRWPSTAAGVALVESLRAQALETPVRNPPLVPEWNNRWFGD